MNIEKFKKMLPDYIDNNLQDDDLQQLESALKESQELRTEYEMYIKTWEALGEYQEIEPRANFVSEFWTKAAEQKLWYERFWYNFQLGLKSHKLATAVVSMCFIFVVSVFAFNQIKVESQIEAQLAQEDIQMMEYLELAENLEVIDDIDLLEDLEILEGEDPLSLKNRKERFTSV